MSKILEHISLVEVNQALIALDTFESLLLLALFNQSTPSCLKVMGGGGGGLCDFSVSPSPFGLNFGTLDFGTSDSGLTIVNF